MSNQLLIQRDLLLSFMRYTLFSIVFSLFLGCQALENKGGPSFQKLSDLGYTPVEIQLGPSGQMPVWSLVLPVSLKKDTSMSSPLQSPWKVLDIWKSDDSLQGSSYCLYLLTRLPYQTLSLDLEMESIERALGATGRPTHSRGITQNGMIGIEACHVDDEGFWRWTLLTPDPVLSKKISLPSMKQPLLLIAVYDKAEDLYQNEELFDAIYKSQQTLRTFSL